MSVDRGFTWMDDETVALIDIFSKSDVQEELRGAKRNIIVYERIAHELSGVGFSRTAYQCREKIKRLRKEYQYNKCCKQNNSKPKKPMKHYELVDKIFNRNSRDLSTSKDLNLPSSENEEEMHPLRNFAHESDASNSFTDGEHVTPQTILPGTPTFAALDSENSNILLDINLPNSPLISQTNEDDSLFLSEDQNYDLSEKDSPLNEIDSPWVPNVVLVENEAINEDLESANNNKAESLQKCNVQSEKETASIKDSYVPPQKKRKQTFLKLVLDNVAETFLSYQENAESKFLDRITHLERERMKRDENMQRLWLEFEERRRKEEQEHELKMLSLLGQFVNELNESNVNHERT